MSKKIASINTPKITEYNPPILLIPKKDVPPAIDEPNQEGGTQEITDGTK